MITKRKHSSNGIKLVTITGLPTQAVTISVYIKAGCRFDPVNRLGIAHFTEHMAFSKTKSFGNSQILARAIEQYGGSHWAFTWIDHQNHIVHLPKEHFDIGAKVLSETLFDLMIEDSEVEKEKGVIKEEILRNRSDPSKAIWDYVWFPLFFQGTPMARPYSGTEKDINLITSQDVQSFVKRNFTPQDMVIFVAGEIEQKDVEDIVEKYFVKIISNNEKRIPNLISDLKNPTLALQDENYHQSSLVIGVKTVPFTSDKKYALEIVKEMLGGYFGAPLIYKLREEGGLIYTWEAFQDNLIDTGYLVMNVSVAHENVARVSEKILNEFERLSRGDFLEEEVETAKSHLVGSLLSNTERGRDYINLYALQELIDPNNFKELNDLIEFYKKISLGDIKKVAAEFIKKENILLGAIGRVDNDQLSSLL
ncbi:MAG: hypothetical protein A2868_00635 [Candidatus Levybacteria bacterium RIFCSPHIGHO2_01_FULL_40_15b]|nr:MAG: hypothetical protein A2868_00635 [Candidatus Levybacteria bacterium RIFCSPHIGHO2_01_FULL_40_15b]